MAKAKTSTKRATARNSKASAKKKGLFSKLNLTSKKSQFIAVILVVAVMGAGWFTYRSFAAQTAIHTWNPNDYICNDNMCGVTENTQKNNQKQLTVAYGSGFRTREKIRLIKDVDYTFCASITSRVNAILTVGQKYGLRNFSPTPLPASIFVTDDNRLNACVVARSPITKTDYIDFKLTKGAINLSYIQVSRNITPPPTNK